MLKSNFYLPVLICFLFLFSGTSAVGQETDWRNAKYGSQIHSDGYIDQPYVVILPDRTWLCVFTTGRGEEGTGGQHIASVRSSDQGKSWSVPVLIEKPGNESSSWAMPYLTSYGRVYVFYTHNGDKIHSLKGKTNIREDMLGWYCFRYSDDGGRSWSARYRIPMRKTVCDLTNDWDGKVQMFWGVGKPVDLHEGMILAFTKINRYLLDNTEGWFFRCDNINTEHDVRKLNWIMLPEGDTGVKNDQLGPVNEEHNLVHIGHDTLYCVERTISGSPAESYSYDGGQSWTLPQKLSYGNGLGVKNPRACPRIWKCGNGKFLLWFHHHGGWDFTFRNPVWLSGGKLENGKIKWGAPEIFLYEEDIQSRMSYPDLIEQDGKYWISETNKSEARIHEVPPEFLAKLWNNYTYGYRDQQGVIIEPEKEKLQADNSIELPQESYQKGLSIEMTLSLTSLDAGQPIIRLTENEQKYISVQTEDFGSISIILNDGNHQERWTSDPGLVQPFGSQQVSVSIDNQSKIIQFVINGIVNDGRDLRQYGWGRFQMDLKFFNPDKLVIGRLGKSQLRPYGSVDFLRVSNRALMNADLIHYQQSRRGN